jgi:DNA-binding CsgD family transcriptional regulator
VSAGDPLVLAIDIADAALAERLAALLAGAPGLRLAAPGEVPDAVIVAPPASVEREADATLTAREAEVLALVAEGASNKAIARRLGISVHTAKFHVAAVLDKLDAASRADAVAQAIRLGVLSL